MRVPPPAVWATFPEPNYIDPVTRGPVLLILNILFVTLVTIAVAGRLHSRLFVKRWFGSDDAMIIPAFILDVGLTACVLLANFKYGWDRHLWDLPIAMIPPAQKIAFAAKVLFTLAATFIRLSLMCFYYRLVKDSGIRWFYWVLHISVVWNMAVCVTFLVLTIWLCSPVQAYWTFPPIGTCINEGKAMLGAGIVNSATDLWTTILPLPIVMRLQMPLRQRIGVCVLLCMGIFATAAGAVRTYYTWKSLLASWDETWWAYWLWVAAAVEIHLGMLCACAPAWKSILQRPLKALNAKMSSKISSLRSRSNSMEPSAAAKRTYFNPLRSLPWFQHTRFEFERTKQGSEEYDMVSLDEKLQHSSDVKPNYRRRDSDMRVYRSPRVAAMPANTAMRMGGIAKRQSIDQTSSRIPDDSSVSDEWLWQPKWVYLPRK